MKTASRKKKIQESLERRREEQSLYQNVNNEIDVNDDSSTKEEESDDYVPPPVEKKSRFSFDATGKINEDIPDKYCHVRNGLRSVREDIYTVMNMMSYQLHV